MPRFIKKLLNTIKRHRALYFGTLSFLALLLLSILYFFFSGIKNDDFDRDKIFRIGRDPNLYPISLMGRERNLSAFINELIFKVAADSHLKVQVMSVPFNLLYDELGNRDVDAILSTISPSAGNRPNYLFSIPLFEMGPVLVTRESSTFGSIEDLAGNNVGIRRGDSLIFDHTGKGILFVQYDSFLEALEDLEKSRIEAVFMPASAAYTYTQVFYPGRLKVATSPLREEGLRIQATKSLENHYFIETFNKGLKAAIQDGWYDQGLIKWGLINPKKLTPEPKLETPTDGTN